MIITSDTFVPKNVTKVDTKHRRIVTKLPVPESIPLLEKMQTYEPKSMSGQAPMIWDRAEGFQVYDPYGNKWLDWSSGVLMANVGHSHPDIREAIVDEAERGLLHTYLFPNEARIRLAQRIVEDVAPDNLDKVFLLSSGTEATETALKLTRTYGRGVGGEQKMKMISFTNAFHGRTLGAQLMGGIPALKEWIGAEDNSFFQVPFPDGFHCRDLRFERFLEALDEANITPDEVAGVIIESFQGGGASFAPPEYMQALRHWCTDHDVMLICDEVQSGFGRTGKMFAFEHYGITPDLICCGKGISSSLPVSAVIGSSELLDQYEAGAMSSTNSGNPVAARAALANIEAMLRDDIVNNAHEMGKVLHEGLTRLREKYESVIGAIHGKGLVAGIHIVQPGSNEPDPNSDLAKRIVNECFKRGLLMFAPVGFGGATIKICPPLVISEEAMLEGLEVFDESFEVALS